MKNPDDASTSQEQETNGGSIDSIDDWTKPDEDIADEQRHILDGQVNPIEDWFDGDRNRQESGEIAVDMGSGNRNEERRNVANEDDHDDNRDYEFVRTVSSSESEYEEIDFDGNRVGQEPWRIVGASKESKGDGRENEEAIVPENEVQVLPAAGSSQATGEMLPVGVVKEILGYQVVVQVTKKDIPPLNKGLNLWVTETKSLLGVIDGAPEHMGMFWSCPFVTCNIDSDVQSWIPKGASVSILQELADRSEQSDEDEKVSHEAESSDDGKDSACERIPEMTDGQNDQRQRNSAGNRQAPSDEDLSTSGSSSVTRAPSHEDTSRANVGPSQSRQTHVYDHPRAPSTTADLSNQFDSMAIGQVTPAGTPLVAPPSVAAHYVPPASRHQLDFSQLPAAPRAGSVQPLAGPSEGLRRRRTRDSSRQPNQDPTSADRRGESSRGNYRW